MLRLTSYLLTSLVLAMTPTWPTSLNAQNRPTSESSIPIPRLTASSRISCLSDCEGVVGTCVPCAYMHVCEKGLAEKRARGALFIESQAKLKLCVGAGEKLKKQRDSERWWGTAKLFGGLFAGFVAGWGTAKLLE